MTFLLCFQLQVAAARASVVLSFRPWSAPADLSKYTFTCVQATCWLQLPINRSCFPKLSIRRASELEKAVTTITAQSRIGWRQISSKQKTFDMQLTSAGCLCTGKIKQKAPAQWQKMFYKSKTVTYVIPIKNFIMFRF